MAPLEARQGRTVLTICAVVILCTLSTQYKLSPILRTLAVESSSIERNVAANLRTANTTTNTNAYKKNKEGMIPLSELTRANETVICPEDLLPVQNIVNTTADALGKIPKIIHMTGKSKCVTKPFHENILAWQLEGYSFYFHDDQAVKRLLDQNWPLFPHLKNAYLYLKNAGGAAKADLWRYLALWTYGGVYTDMDSKPNTGFHSNTITPDMDAFFLIESQFKILSQWFFAASPKHPLMFIVLHEVLLKMHTLSEVGTLEVPVHSGPHALHWAFETFQGIPAHQRSGLWKKAHLPEASVYHWKGANPNRTLTVAGTSGTGHQWVTRVALSKQDKRQGWKSMNITDYQDVQRQSRPIHKSCLDVIWEAHQPEMATR